MITGQSSRNLQLGGMQFGSSYPVNGESLILIDIDIPPATQGVLTTRTDAVSGVFTFPAHTFSVGNRIHVYWPATVPGSMAVSNRGTVSAVTATTVTVGVAGFTSGGPLPLVGTLVNVMAEVYQLVAIDADNLLASGVSCDAPFTAVFLAGTTATYVKRLFNAGGVVVQDGLDGTAPTLVGIQTSLFITHGDDAQSHKFQAAFLLP